MFTIPDTATTFGFVAAGLGAHSSRTMMLAELRLLLQACPATCQRHDYKAAIVDENVLLKKTQTTRYKSLRYLHELYALDRGIILFRALRDLWDDHDAAQPLLALLCAVARDPGLRATAAYVTVAPAASPVTAQALANQVESHLQGRLNRATLARIGRNTASSWVQSGHLQGRAHKTRVTAQHHPTSVAYALLLGHLCGSRGAALFQTPWARLLDAPAAVLHEQAFRASQRGWLDYRHTGTVTDVTFSYLLRHEEPS